MAAFVALLVSLFTFSVQPPLAVLESDVCPPYTQGYTKDGQVILCPNQLTLPRQQVLNHEIIHLVQDNFGVDTLLPKGTVTYLVNETLSERETLSVIIHYSESGYMMSEFEARVLSTLPPSVIMYLLEFSEIHAYLTSAR